jgi:hypothetical protein
MMSDGLFGLYRADFRPNEPSYNPGVPNIHFHRTFAELLYVLSGTIELFDGEKWIAGTDGDSLYVPIGGIHGFQHLAPERASMLQLFAPGVPREAYFEGMRDVTPQEFMAFSLAHDTYRIDRDDVGQRR